MNAQSIIQPKRPTGPQWRRADYWHPPAPLAAIGYPIEAWENQALNLFVLSAVEVTNDPGDINGPQYHLSVTAFARRCTSHAAQIALRDFGLEDAKEDNHVPGGKARNFWRPVADHLSGFECPCVEEEPTMREDKGDYIWRGVTR